MLLEYYLRLTPESEELEKLPLRTNWQDHGMALRAGIILQGVPSTMVNLVTSRILWNTL